MPEEGEPAGIVARAKSKQDRWMQVPAVAQASEAMDSPSVCDSKWSQIYRLFSASGETAQDEVFAAVNLYFLKNGSSPFGKYSKKVRTAGGVEVLAGEIVNITGKNEGEIRQFLRGRLEDSYIFLKHNPAVQRDAEVVAKAQNAGIARDRVFLLADWLGENCPHFVGNEAEDYRKYRATAISLANVRRVGAAEVPDKAAVAAKENPEVRSQEAGLRERPPLF